MLTTLIRTLIMYIVIVLTLRAMGKKQLSDFEPSELVVTIMMSEIAALPVQDNSQPLLSSVFVILLLLVFEVVLSFAAYKCPRIRKAVYGFPSVFFEKGKIHIEEMEKQRFSVTDLMESVRNNGFASLCEVDYVIMETNGNLSVIPNSASRSITPADMGLTPSEALISYVIIDAGSIYEGNLKRLGFDGEWLKKQLEKENIRSVKDVFCFSADKSGNTFIMKNEIKNGSKNR